MSLPIIGLVTPTNNIILDEKYNSNLHNLLPSQASKANKFYGFLPPNPAIVVNVSDLIQSNQKISNRPSSLLKDSKVIEPLILKGNFNMTMENVKIINNESNIPF